MPRVLTVDDSRAIRLLVSKQMSELGFEVEEAEDGIEGLSKMNDGRFDLVLLDVTMPNLDGPGMLTKLRASGDRTPVLMLTSEAKTSIVAALIKLGIDDYVLKPFKPEELRAKVAKILKLPNTNAAATAQTAPEGGPVTPAATVATAGKSQRGVLVIDDMENVHKKLRSLIPAAVTIDGFTTATEALSQARAHGYRLILMDIEMPEVTISSFLKQLRILQPEAKCLGMALRGPATLAREVREMGFDDVLTKPFAPENIDGLIEQHFADADSPIVREDNVLRIVPFDGREDRIERHYNRLGRAFRDCVAALGEACFDEAILEATSLPPASAMRAAQFIVDATEVSSKIGITLRLVTSPEVAKALRGFEETRTLQCFASVDDARAVAA